MTTDTAETKRFYVGVRPCGCMTSALVADLATPKDIDQFDKENLATGCVTMLKDLTREKFLSTFKLCKCDVGHNANSAPDWGGARSVPP